MGICVMKFGGAAMADVKRFSELAALVEERQGEWGQVVVVVSAMGETTNQLMDLAGVIHSDPPKREQDMLISVGERVSMALLAMALDVRGIDAISFTGSQAGIITTSDHLDAQILEVRSYRVSEALEQGKVVIVAGFQGVSREKEITTLGRGGSDTSAVALAASLGAERVEFYKDVPGIGAVNPKMEPETHIFPSLSYDEALEIVGEGAEVLHDRSLKFAKKHNVALEIRPFYEPSRVGTHVSQSCQGNLRKNPRPSSANPV